jgi:7-carboxy-7-deazaguanine synthase
LRCWFCDTPYASWSPEGDDLSVEEILLQIEALDCRPGNVLVAVRNPNSLDHLKRTLDKTDTRKIDIAVLAVRSGITRSSPDSGSSSTWATLEKWVA